MKNVLFVLLLIGGQVNASKPLFDLDKPLQAVLSAPITQTYRERKQAVRLYQEGSLSYLNEQNVKQRLDVKIRTRGNFRRLNCAYPPLRLNFSKKANNNTAFERQDKLKLVGPCKPGARYQEFIGLEYLTYRLWQAISPYHFRTRLLELSYIDTDKKRTPWQATTFVIEDINDVAKRVELERLEQPKVKRQQMNLSQTALLELFQLLIGNSDYSTLAAPAGENCCHNARLLVAKNTLTDAIPVPYDFDVSGFVDAPYAVPAAQYPIKKVRQRYFTGWCKEDRHFLAAIDVFNDRKPMLYDIVQSANVINDKSRNKAVKYLDSFYKLIGDDKRVKREILGRCRGSVIKG